ncbi:hypothetical protein A5819_003554 [Enterococcus sp. 7E2_DIV0204]|uniref:ASCH domain-containing protein n=1 Tax=unclassified Enterococcus TaxID=2608891 RepID=UPI000A341A96|nr:MULTISPECIES: ASCH domain-containing protein [unclassified Enterococcus]OTN84000.1 hypothetical protein A5819_003550 [Enterococcus sp. 7E2_DIV0204]OTN84004.1 hypothetical protein A5819_003554 [Enterococcus sp. 7E2_DIV0204]OTP47217.1 hypothetical protein A5884_003592 [Enterococcus sp. 7D2_DIV0200]
MKVLLSIKPEFVEKIIAGTKRFEYRSRMFKNKNVSSVIIYSTVPVGKVIGEFTIEDIIEDTPEKLWQRTKEYSGITESFFKGYFSGKEKGYAIQIKNFLEYERPLDLKEIGVGAAPQSFKYIEK